MQSVELTKLAEKLREIGIPCIGNHSYSNVKSVRKLGIDVSIERIIFTYNDIKYSVATGSGTYGDKVGLLELLNLTDDKKGHVEPIGWLSSNDVLEYIKTPQKV
jgi:hypothetical protein